MENDRSSEVLTRSGVMGTVDELRSRGIELMHRMSTRTSDVKRVVSDTMDKAERELHSNPAKWAGIAAGASFVLGMIGREMRHRGSLKARRGLPDLIIIETA